MALGDSITYGVGSTDGAGSPFAARGTAPPPRSCRSTSWSAARRAARPGRRQRGAFRLDDLPARAPVVLRLALRDRRMSCCCTSARTTCASTATGPARRSASACLPESHPPRPAGRAHLRRADHRLPAGASAAVDRRVQPRCAPDGGGAPRSAAAPGESGGRAGAMAAPERRRIRRDGRQVVRRAHRHRSGATRARPAGSPRLWSCGWHRSGRNAHTGNHNSKIAEGRGQPVVDR